MTFFFRRLKQYSERKIFASLVAIMLVALLAAGTFLWCLQRVLDVRQASIKVSQIQTQLGDFYAQMLNAETAQRGFIITGDEAYLDPYRVAEQKVPQQVKQLVALSAPYPYASNMKEVQATATAKWAEMERAIAARRGGGAEAAAAVVQAGDGESDMNRLRALIGNINRIQSADLVQKRALGSLYGAWARWIGIVMLVAIVALAGLVAFWFLQSLTARRALDRAQDDFTALASHQLRTPATGVKSILAVLRAGDVGPLNARQQHLVDRAISSNERELRIINELLTAARADAGQILLRPAKLDVRELVAAVVAEQARIIDAKHQHLTVRQPDRAIELEGDVEKLHMVLSNLIDNASKYTPNEGRIDVRVREHHRQVCIDVADTGRGMEEAEVAIIFDRFARAREFLMSGTEGTGLGLYLARRFATLHNGTIEVKSKKGLGSTFTLTLPRGGQHHAA